MIFGVAFRIKNPVRPVPFLGAEIESSQIKVICHSAFWMRQPNGDATFMKQTVRCFLMNWFQSRPAVRYDQFACQLWRCIPCSCRSSTYEYNPCAWRRYEIPDI